MRKIKDVCVATICGAIGGGVVWLASSTSSPIIKMMEADFHCEPVNFSQGENCFIVGKNSHVTTGHHVIILTDNFYATDPYVLAIGCRSWKISHSEWKRLDRDLREDFLPIVKKAR